MKSGKGTSVCPDSQQDATSGFLTRITDFNLKVLEKKHLKRQTQLKNIQKGKNHKNILFFVFDRSYGIHASSLLCPPSP